MSKKTATFVVHSVSKGTNEGGLFVKGRGKVYSNLPTSVGY